MNHDTRLSPMSRRVFGAALGLVFVLMVLRNTGLYPIIMADEWNYSSMARLMPLSQVSVPSYLYFAVFGATARCGDGFLDCARLYNALALVASAPFLYLLARRVTAPATAAVVTVLALLAPLNVYTAFFMPESSYFLGFWALTWLVFHFQDRPGAPRALLLGAGLGVLSMIKVHALFLLPALSLYLLWASATQRTPGWPGRTLAALLAMPAAALAVRLGLGYLLAGAPGLNLIGTLYQEQSDTSQGHKPLAQLLGMAFGNLRGHLLGLAILYGLPLAALASELVSGAALRPSARRNLAVYTLLMLGSMLAVTVLFTATVAGNGPFENTARLHMRYYSFTLPLLAMLAAAHADSAAPAGGRAMRLLWGALLVAAIACAWRVLPAAFTSNIVDNPELHGLLQGQAARNVTAILGLVSVLAWIWQPRHGARLFVLLFLPVSIAISGVAVSRKLQDSASPDPYDTAGLYVRTYLPHVETDRLTIVGDNHGGLFKVKYYTDNLKPQLLQWPAGRPLNPGDLPAGTRWLLVMGPAQTLPGLVHAQTPRFSLSRLLPNDGSRYQLDFGQDERNGYLRRTEGLTEVGGSGRWSLQKEVSMEFVKPLPRQLTLTFNAYGFGPNVGQELVVQLGQERQSFTLGDQPASATLRFRNGGDISRLRLIVPQPVSPQQLGQSGDPRTLGVFLIGLTIGSSDPVVQEQLQHDTTPLQL